MSDRLTNLEIQDVLSSIRRLVSEDNRHRTAPGTPDPEPSADDSEDRAPEAGKLVLTEALRVPVERGAPAGAGPSRDEAGDIAGLRLSVSGERLFDEGDSVPPVANAIEEALDDAPSLEDTIAELEAAVSRRGWDFEPDGSEVARAGAADSELEEAFERGFGVDEAAEEDEAELVQPITAAGIGAESRADEETEDTEDTGGLGAASPEGVTQEADDPEPASAKAAMPEAPTDTFEFAHAREDVPTGDEDAPVLVGSTFLHTTAAMAGRSLQGARAPGAEAEDAADTDAQEAKGREPTGAEASPDEAPKRPSRIRRLTLMPSERADLDEVLADEQLSDISPAIPGGDADEDSASLFSPGDETVVDIDMLRDLVAEIIRQELQGALGERITRNVRMLVRREINRALEGRQFD